MIPMDFSANSEIAIKKAVEICEPGSCRFHLFHVVSNKNPSLFFRSRKRMALIKFEEKEAEKKLTEWKACIQRHTPDIEVNICVACDSNVLQCIAIKARRIRADLIVIGRQVTHFRLPFLNRVSSFSVARKSNCAVLSAKPGALNTEIKNVVVPIRESLSASKLNALRVLCRKRGVRVFLIFFLNRHADSESFSNKYFLPLYQWLKTSLNCPVEYSVLPGRPRTGIILRFAENWDADLLLFDREEERKVNWTWGEVEDALPPSSKLQVLTV